jgi:hypothetical protein
MTFPSIEQYTDALQIPHNTLLDPTLAAGTVETNSWGLPFGRSGGFALTFKITNGHRAYAFRCFQSDRATMHQRYTAISEAVTAANLPYFVAFQYLDPGIRVQQNGYPAIRMDWADGLPLGVYVEQQYKDSGRMRALQQQLHGMALVLEGAGIAHGDIQTGNILVGPSGDIKLVDYDGMYVPALASLGSIETGHPNFQHPQRAQLKPFDPTLDRFSFALLHATLSALIESPSLWTTLKSDPEALLLRASDLATPGSSAAFHTLTRLPGSGPVFQRLLAVTTADYTQIPTFNDFLSGRNIPTPRPVAGPAATAAAPPTQATATGTSGTRWYQPDQSPPADAGPFRLPAAYASRFPVLAAADTKACFAAAGQQVELIGRVQSIERGENGRGLPYVLLLLSPSTGDGVQVSIWAEGLTALAGVGITVDDTWINSWISITGTVDTFTASDSLQAAFTASGALRRAFITLTDPTTLAILSAPQARWRMAGAVAPAAPAPSTLAPTTASPNVTKLKGLNVDDEVKRLTDMHARGVLSDNEFAAALAKVKIKQLADLHAQGILSDAEFSDAVVKVRRAAAERLRASLGVASSTQPGWYVPVGILVALALMLLFLVIVAGWSSNNSSSSADPTADTAPAAAITLASEPPPTPSQSLKGTFKLARADDGKVLRWDSCRGPIQVAVNYGTLNTTEHERDEALVRSALAKISAATGVTYEYAGATRIQPSSDDRGDVRLSRAAIIIGFLPSTEAMWKDPSMKDYTEPDTARYWYSRNPTTRKWREISQGDIQILPDADAVEERLLYQIAAISGLDSAENATSPEIMGWNMDDPQYGPGDLAGLKLVGSRECS